jgi:hypothetical protein
MKKLVVLLLIISGRTYAYDCSNSKPFVPFEHHSVSISVGRSYWAIENGVKIEKSVTVCRTNTPLEIGVYDIRGREEEWYYCFHQVPRPNLSCETIFRGRPSQIIVRPAAVIRRYDASSARDIHAHTFLVPEGNEERYLDTFARSLSFDLKKQNIIIDSVSGGRGPESGQDSYDVRLHFY